MILPAIPNIADKLSVYSPKLLEVGGNRHAAVAMLLRQREMDLEVLFIEREHCPTDPWSGQMAFPGGMVDSADADARAAAEREVEEEVGIRLAQDSYLGRLDDMQGRHAGHPQGIIVSGYVYAVDGWTRVRANYEVRDVVWAPLRDLLDPQRYVTVRHPRAPDQRFPGIRVSAAEHQVVWGLTRRFLESFFHILQLPMRG